MFFVGDRIKLNEAGRRWACPPYATEGDVFTIIRIHNPSYWGERYEVWDGKSTYYDYFKQTNFFDDSHLILVEGEARLF